MRSWQIGNVGRTDALRLWSRDLAQAFVRLEARSPTMKGFRGRIDQSETGPIKVSRVTASAHQVDRLAEHIRQNSHDVCFVNIQNSARGYIRQGTNGYTSQPMDVVIVDTREPFSIRHETNFDLHSITLPVTLLSKEMGRGLLPLSRTAEGRETARVLSGLSNLILSGAVPDQDKPVIAEQVIRMVGFAHKLGVGQARTRQHTSAQLAMLQSFIGRNLALPNLGAALLAQQFSLSLRRIHSIFERSGHTVSQYINTRRLACVAAVLADPHRRQRPINQIAFDAGYVDISYFNRRFRRAYGCTPREYRAAHWTLALEMGAYGQEMPARSSH